MITLAVMSNEETFERMGDPLRERGVDPEFVPYRERTLPLDAPVEGFDAGFVYPARVMEGEVIATRLSAPWVNDRDAVLTSRNKAGVIARLSRAGLPVPETAMVSNPADDDALVEAFEQVGPPVVVKPNSATRGIGVARADDLDSFLGVADYLRAIHDFEATGDKSFLVQEYLPEPRDYRIMVVDGAYAGAVERRLPEAALDAGRWKHNVHRDAVAEGVRPDREHRELAEEVAAALDIRYLGVDLLVTDDRAVVGETNARPTIDDAAKYEPDFWDRLSGLIEETAAARD